MSVITEFTGVTDVEDTDLLLVQNSQTVGFKMTGLNYKKLHDIIIASSLTVTGPKIHAGSAVRIFFNADIAGANSSDAMVINYNGSNVTVKAPKDGSLVNYTAKAVGNGYLYCQAYTTLEFLYDGTNFVIIGNPVVISNSDYTIYTDGTSQNKLKSKTISGTTGSGSALVIAQGTLANQIPSSAKIVYIECYPYIPIGLRKAETTWVIYFSTFKAIGTGYGYGGATNVDVSFTVYYY